MNSILNMDILKNLDNIDQTEMTESSPEEVSVDQNWINRAIHFAELYTTLFSIEEVNKQFKLSEFTDFSVFLHYNQLFLINGYYVHVASSVTVLKSDLVTRCYQQHQAKYKGLSDFLAQQDIFQLNGCYYRININFSKVKFLEILINIPWAKLMPPDSNLIDFINFNSLFQNTEISSRLVILGCCCQFWQQVELNYISINNHGGQVNKFNIGIQIDTKFLKICQTFCQEVLDHLVNQFVKRQDSKQ